jgi:hypothetical protein
MEGGAGKVGEDERRSRCRPAPIPRMRFRSAWASTAGQRPVSEFVIQVDDALVHGVYSTSARKAPDPVGSKP